MIIIDNILDFMKVLEQLEIIYEEQKSDKTPFELSKQAIMMSNNFYQLPYFDKMFNYFKDIDLEYLTDEIFKDIEKSKESENRLEFYMNKNDDEKIEEYSGDVGFLQSVLMMSQFMAFDSRICQSEEFTIFKEKIITGANSGELAKQKPTLTLLS